MKDNELKILKEFLQEQMSKMPEDKLGWLRDEYQLMVYASLIKNTGLRKSDIKPFLISLRNSKYIELSPAVDYDGVPNGSGYMLTEKGVALCNEIFLDQLDELI